MQTPLPEEGLDRRELVSPAHVGARTQAIWEKLEQDDLRKRRSYGRPLLAASALLALTSWGLGAFDTQGARPSPAPALIAGATKQVPEAVAIAEGAYYQAGPEASIGPVATNDATVRVALKHGAATWHVDRSAQAPLVVQLGEGWVSGTQAEFRVTRVLLLGYAKHVIVVDKGTVKVFDGSRERELPAGARFDFTMPHERAATSDATNAARAPVEKPAHEASAKPPSARRESAAPGVDAAGLFEQAALAQREQDFARAASAYARLLHEFPKDARASLSAFELGRLRMDRLSDPAGAVVALELSVRSRSPFQEEALARLVRAHDAMDAEDACRRTRADYLERYPQGLYLKTITARCPPGVSPP